MKKVRHIILTMMRKNRDIDQTRTVKACSAEQSFLANYLPKLHVIYTASKVKHHLNIFLEKAVNLSNRDFFLVTFLKRDKVVTIYSKFRFDYH